MAGKTLKAPPLEAFEQSEYLRNKPIEMCTLKRCPSDQ
jgi:hypothetical protein